MGQKVAEYGPGVVLGGAGLALFFYVVFHWRAVCRRIDEREARKNRAWGISEKFTAFSNLFTPVYLILVMALLFLVSLAVLFGLGAPLISLPRSEEQKPIVPVSTKP